MKYKNYRSTHDKSIRSNWNYEYPGYWFEDFGLMRVTPSKVKYSSEPMTDRRKRRAAKREKNAR